MNALQWTCIFTGALLLWFPALRWPALGALACGYGLAFWNGQLDLFACAPILLLAVAAYAASTQSRWAFALSAYVLFPLLAVGLFMHWLPGFHNPQVVEPQRLTPDAAPFNMYLNLDKPLIGYWLLLAWPYLSLAKPPRVWLSAGLVAMAATTAACLGAALLIGFVGWAPKWPEWGWLWVLNNLLLVSMAETALFQGYVQDRLGRLLGKARLGPIAAIVGAAILFGAAHHAGGWQLIALAGLAGLGNGFAYRYGGLQAAVIAHFGLNLMHFGLFTYPMLAR
ncbi:MULTISPECIES: CPBP family intramembrane glutamic endopeptidase [Rhodomicrobium]|uniref:CPBP family intramembrane glutamic endopeptidase n=1 Tax=Rhodomicrobium TaxID=1068 RepID=UPI000B4B24BF|nr:MULTISPECIES: CPBP family intramembrane glutamic endopeptidase [Rhodomicrobium]